MYARNGIAGKDNHWDDYQYATSEHYFAERNCSLSRGQLAEKNFTLHLSSFGLDCGKERNRLLYIIHHSIDIVKNNYQKEL